VTIRKIALCIILLTSRKELPSVCRITRTACAGMHIRDSEAIIHPKVSAHTGYLYSPLSYVGGA
jgi:hypothetical protein